MNDSLVLANLYGYGSDRDTSYYLFTLETKNRHRSFYKRVKSDVKMENGVINICVEGKQILITTKTGEMVFPMVRKKTQLNNFRNVKEFCDEVGFEIDELDKNYE